MKIINSSTFNIYLFKSRIKLSSQNVLSTASQISTHISESLRGYRDSVFFDTFTNSSRSFYEKNKRYRDLRANIRFLNLFPKYIIESLSIISLSLLFIYSAYTVSFSDNFLSTIVAFAVGAQRLLPASQQVYFACGTISSCSQIIDPFLQLNARRWNSSSLNSLYRRTKTSSQSKHLSDAFRKPMLYQSSNVTFSNNQSNIIYSPNISISFQDKVLFVGPSGCGKSTFLESLAGFRPPETGSISFNSIDIYSSSSDLIFPEWHSRVAYLSQIPVIYSGSILSNVCFGIDPQYWDIGRATESIIKAGLYEYIDSSSQLINAPVSEVGDSLSGGQKQKLSFARAFYSGRDILILDESTSNLDNDSEQHLMQYILDPSNHFTILMVSHNLAFKEYFDQVVTFQTSLNS